MPIVQTLKAIDTEGLRLEWPSTGTHALVDVGCRACAEAPADRPRFSEIETELLTLVESQSLAVVDIGALLNGSLEEQLLFDSRQATEQKRSSWAVIKAASLFKRGVRVMRSTSAESVG